MPMIRGIIGSRHSRMPMIREIIGSRHSRMPMIRGIIAPGRSRPSVGRPITFSGVAKGVGAVVLGIIAFDLVATLVTLAVGAEFLKR